MHELFGVGLDFPEDKPSDVRKKADLFAKARSGVDWWHDCTAANLWTASFFVPLTKLDDPLVPTQDTFLSYLLHRQNRPQMTGAANSLASELRFFHWHLEFPDVFERGGFDVILGNPPWDTLSPDAKEFFSTYDPQVRRLAPRQQEMRIKELCETPAIAAEWNRWCRSLYTFVRFLKQSGRYRLFAPGNLGKGDFNVYRMFVESAMKLVQPNGFLGQVVPEGLYNGPNCMAIRKALFEDCELRYVLGFENAREVWFDGIDTRTKFCLYAAHKGGSTAEFNVAFNIRTLDRLSRVRAGEFLRMPVSLVSEFSHSLLQLWNFRTKPISMCAARFTKVGLNSGMPHRTDNAELICVKLIWAMIANCFPLKTAGYLYTKGEWSASSITGLRDIAPVEGGLLIGRNLNFQIHERLSNLNGTLLPKNCPQRFSSGLNSIA